MSRRKTKPKKTPTTPTNQDSASSLIQLHSSPIKRPFLATIDDHKRDEWSEHIYPGVYTEITEEEMLKLLFRDQKVKIKATQVPQPPDWTDSTPESDYCEYLNVLSKHVQKRYKAEYTIKFHSSGNMTLTRHPTRTKCRPDIIAIREHLNPKSGDKTLNWFHLEGTGEKYSNKPGPHAQTAAYTSYHLQARPDLVSVVGIFVRSTSFTLFHTNACRVLRTPDILWKDAGALQLLWAYVWRLYHPELDKSIQIDLKGTSPCFRITGGNGNEYIGFNVRRAGDSIGRRTIIMGSDRSDLVIKEQYIEDGRRFKEGPILEKIHKDGRFPGVVRLDNYEAEIKNSKGATRIQCQYKKPGNGDTTSTLTRFKTRLVMRDSGSRLMDVSTPREFLMGIYDLLEISRMLFKKYKILHRDISADNVLLRDEPAPYTDKEFRKDLDDMYFSAYLLEEPPSHGSKASHPLETRVLLIDFDCSEVQDPTFPIEGQPKDRTGTPIFMARMVRSDVYPAGLAVLPPIPSINPKRIPRYPMDRLDTFPKNDPEIINIPRNHTRATNAFRHLPRYDAESAYWCILWWCIQAIPADHPKGSPGEKIASGDWVDLVDKNDRRHAIYVSSFPQNCFHPSYSELEPLLHEMSEYLHGDLDFAEDKSRAHVEYLHEAFQRIILNFLVANASKEFMNLPKSPSPRGVEGSAMKRLGTTLPSKTGGIQSTRSQIAKSNSSQVPDAEPSPPPETSKRKRTKKPTDGDEEGRSGKNKKKRK